MEREKRSTKPPEPYIIPKICYPRIRKKPKKKATEVVQYQTIPFPLKFVYPDQYFLLYGEFVLKEENGSIVSETATLNHYLNFTGVEIVKEPDFTMITLHTEKKYPMELPPWQKIVEKLIDSGNPEFKKWAGLIRNYSLNYEELFRALASDTEIRVHGFDEIKLAAMTEEANKTFERLFKTYPCLMLGSTHLKGVSKMNDIVFNEAYLWELGYTLETFSSSILQDGIPQMMPDTNTCMVKTVIENNFTVGVTPEVISEITMKNGHKRKVRFKMWYFIRYKDRTFDLSGVLAIVGRVNPSVSDKPSEELQLNKTFLKKVIKKEKESNKFLKKYYNTSVTLPYSNLDKTCKIRHFDRPGDFEEEEYDIYDHKFE